MDGTLKISRTVPLQGQKDLLWNKIKTIGGGNPAEIEADINVDSTGARFYDLQPGIGSARLQGSSWMIQTAIRRSSRSTPIN